MVVFISNSPKCKGCSSPVYIFSPLQSSVYDLEPRGRGSVHNMSQQKHQPPRARRTTKALLARFPSWALVSFVVRPFVSAGTNFAHDNSHPSSQTASASTNRSQSLVSRLKWLTSTVEARNGFRISIT